LTSFEDLKPLSTWFKATFEPLKNIPRYLIPCYFDAIVSGVYNVLINQVNELMPEYVMKHKGVNIIISLLFLIFHSFIKNGHSFTQSLALSTLQFLSVCRSANLPGFSPAIAPPKPPKQCVTLSAGLPHFSTGELKISFDLGNTKDISKEEISSGI